MNNEFECRYFFELPKPKILGSIVIDDGTYHLILDDKHSNQSINFIFKKPNQTD